MLDRLNSGAHPTVVSTSVLELARCLQSARFVGCDYRIVISRLRRNVERAPDDVQPIVVAGAGVV